MEMDHVHGLLRLKQSKTLNLFIHIYSKFRFTIGGWENDFYAPMKGVRWVWNKQKERQMVHLLELSFCILAKRRKENLAEVKHFFVFAENQ